jgi:hypothetical protein
VKNQSVTLSEVEARSLGKKGFDFAQPDTLGLSVLGFMFHVSGFTFFI